VTPVSAGRAARLLPHRLVLGAAPLLLASCVSPSKPAPRPAPVAAAAPAAAPRVVTPPVAPAGARFTFEGALTQGGLAIGQAPTGTTALFLDGHPIPMGGDGKFLIAFDRDQDAAQVIEARFASGASHRQTLRVSPRAWKIESLPTLPRGTTPSPEFTRRRNGELAQINAARRISSGSEGWRQRFLWPTTGRISGVFGSQRIYAGEPGAYHSGVDVARPTGTPVVSPADGVVILAATMPFSLEGNLLMIDHGMGLNSAFLHLSRIDVKPGQKVTRGQLVGAIGATGRATGPHLHWGMKWFTARIDPQMLAGPMP